MACGKVLFCFALLARLSVILAEEVANGENQSPSPSEPPKEEYGAHDDRILPFFTPFVNIFSQLANSSGFTLPFLNPRSLEVNSSSEPQREDHGSHNDRFIPFLTPFANIFSQFLNSSGLPFSSFFTPRSGGLGVSDFDVELENDTDSNEHSNRFFFHLPRFVGCNFTDNPGLACFSCRQRINCLRSNVGVVTRCSFLFPFCSGNGTCSRTPGELC